MDAKKWARPSWAWTSILIGRDVLKKNGICQVGYGSKIKDLQDAWITGIKGHRLRLEGRATESENIRVAQLIEPNGMRWELSQLQHITTKEERQAIRSIHLSRKPREDMLVWPIVLDGVGRPKLVYRKLRETAMNNTEREIKWQHDPGERKWKKIRRSHSIPKVKTFVWRSTQHEFLSRRSW